MQTIESQQQEKEGFGFAKSMEREREREKEQELELDRLRLAQLKAKFDETLEALWDTGSGNKQGTDSIWAAPSLSIPSKPLWPTDANETFFTVSNTNNDHVVDTPFQESIVDDSPLIPWDLDLVGTKDCSVETVSKNNTRKFFIGSSIHTSMKFNILIIKMGKCWRKMIESVPKAQGRENFCKLLF